MGIKKVHLVPLFIALLTLSSVFHSSLVLDQTLAPRSLAFSLSLCVFTLFVFLKGIQRAFVLDITQLLMFAFCIYSFTSSFWSLAPSETYTDSSRLFIGFVIFYYSSYLFKHHRTEFIKALQVYSILMVTIELLFVGYQYTLVHWNHKDDIYALTGINSHKNLCSSFLFLNLAILVMGYNQFGKKWAVMNYIFIVLCLLILITLKTKAVGLGLLASLAVFVSFRIIKQVTAPLTPVFGYSIGLILAFVFFMVLTPSVTKHLIEYNQKTKTTNSIEYDNERLMLWDKTHQLINDRLLFGSGGGNWQLNYMKNGLSGLYRAEDLNYSFQRPHNDWLWIISEYGLIGSSIYFIFLLVLFTRTMRFIRQNSHDPIITPLKLVMAFCIGFFVVQFFDFPKERLEHVALLSILFGFMHAHGSETTTEKKQIPQIKLHPLVIFAALILVVLFTTQRFRGEYYVKKMYGHHRNQEHALVLLYSTKAKNKYYVTDPLTIPLDWYTGNSLASMNRFKEANKAFLSAYKISPYNRNVLNDLASSYEKSGMPDSAIYFYKEAIKISPRFDEPYLNLVAIYIAQENYQMADSCLKLIKHDSERRTHYQRMVNAFLGRN